MTREEMINALVDDAISSTIALAITADRETLEAWLCPLFEEDFNKNSDSDLLALYNAQLGCGGCHE